MSDEHDRTAFDWMRSRPPSVKEAMRKFPPVCRVTTTRPLHTPAPGRVGRVISYVEKTNDSGIVNIRVVDEMDYLDTAVGHPIAAECQQEWLTVIQYDGNKTPEWIDRVMAGEDVPATNPGLDGKIEGELAPVNVYYRHLPPEEN